MIEHIEFMTAELDSLTQPLGYRGDPERREKQIESWGKGLAPQYYPALLSCYFSPPFAFVDLGIVEQMRGVIAIAVDSIVAVRSEEFFRAASSQLEGAKDVELALTLLSGMNSIYLFDALRSVMHRRQINAQLLASCLDIIPTELAFHAKPFIEWVRTAIDPGLLPVLHIYELRRKRILDNDQIR